MPPPYTAAQATFRPTPPVSAGPKLITVNSGSCLIATVPVPAGSASSLIAGSLRVGQIRQTGTGPNGPYPWIELNKEASPFQWTSPTIGIEMCNYSPAFDRIFLKNINYSFRVIVTDATGQTIIILGTNTAIRRV